MKRRGESNERGKKRERAMNEEEEWGGKIGKRERRENGEKGG